MEKKIGPKKTRKLILLLKVITMQYQWEPCECNAEDCLSCNGFDEAMEFGSQPSVMSIQSIIETYLHEEQQVAVKSPRSVQRSSKTPSALHKISKKIEKRSRSSKSGPQSTSGAYKHQITLKDQNMHRLVFQEGGLVDGTEVFYVDGGKKLQYGIKSGSGIKCKCCGDVISPSQFEAHAGRRSRKKPYNYIHLASGMSLHQFACLLKMNPENPQEKQSDDLCRECHKGRDLLPCNTCNRSFHRGCIKEKNIDPDIWYCRFCKLALKCGGSVAKAMKGQRVEGVDLIEQITKRSLQIVNNPETSDVVACALCRACEFNKTGFNDQTVIVCDQCEKEYHIGCLRKTKMHDLKELPAGNWFCHADCGRLHSALKNVVASGPEKVPEPLLETIKRKFTDPDVDSLASLEVKWIVIHGKEASDENRALLSDAVDMFHDCFNPIVDSLTGSDFIPSMAYGQQMGDSDFVGVYTAMLTINSKVVTAGMFRVFGKEMAELPIVGTRRPYQGKGYFQLFFTCFEKLLMYLNVKKIVLPAAEDAKSMWINRFGFQNVNPEQLDEYRQTQTSMVAFHGTSLLEKEVLQGEVTFEEGARFSLDIESRTNIVFRAV